MKILLIKNRLWITGMLLLSTCIASAQCVVGGTNFDVVGQGLCDPPLTDDNNAATGWLSSNLSDVLNSYCGVAERHYPVEYAKHRSDGFQNNIMSANKGEYPFTLWAQNQNYIHPDRDPGSTAIFANPRMASPYYMGRPGDNILVNVGSNSGVPFFNYTIYGLEPGSQATITLDAFSLLDNWNNMSTGNYGGVWGYRANADGTITNGNSPSVRVGHTLSGATISGGTTQAIAFGNSVNVTYTGTADGNGRITFYVARGNESYRAPIGIDNVVITGTPKPVLFCFEEPCIQTPLVVSLTQDFPSGTTYSWIETVTGQTGTNSNFIFEPKDAGVEYSITATVTMPGGGCPATVSDVYKITAINCCDDGQGNPLARINIFHDDFGYFPDNSTYQYRDEYGNLHTQPTQGIYHCGGGDLCSAAYGGGEVPYVYPQLINAADLGINLIAGNLYDAALYLGGAAVSFRQPFYPGVTRDNTSTDGRGGMLCFSLGTAGQNDVVLYKKKVDGLCPDKKVYFSAYYAPIDRGINADGYPDKVGELVLEIVNASNGAVLYATGRQVVRGSARWIRVADEFVAPPGVTAVYLQIKHIGWSMAGSDGVCKYAIDDVLFQVCAPPNVMLAATVKGNANMNDLCEGNDITLTAVTSDAIDDFYTDIGYLFQYTLNNPQYDPNPQWNDLAPVGSAKEFVIADPPYHPLFSGLNNGDKIYFRVVAGDRTYLINQRAEWISMDPLSPCRGVSISIPLVEASFNCQRCTAPKDITIASTTPAPVVGGIKTVNLCPPGGTTTLTTNNIKPDVGDYSNYTITWYKGNQTTVTGTVADPGVTANALTVNYADATAAGVKYYVQVVDRAMPGTVPCHRWDSILVISNPAAGITNNTGTTVLTCATPSISLTATGGVSYAWTGSLGNNADATVNTPGTYTVTVTTAGGCTDTESITITENKTPPLAGITNNTGTTVLTCTTPNINLTATGGVSYSWNNGLGNNASATVSSAGTYTVIVTDSNGCIDTESITITSDKGSLVAGITNNTGTTELTCATPSISLTATGSGTYAWSHSLGSNADVTITAPGVYTVTVTASNGCTDTESITITENKASPTLSLSASPIYYGDDVTLTATLAAGCNPTGTVTLFVNGSSTDVQPASGNGVYTFILITPNTGNYDFYATYSGDTSNNPAQATAITGFAVRHKPVTVIYDANGGTGTQTDPLSPYTVGSIVTVLDTGSIVRPHYVFTCWNTRPDGLGVSYVPGDDFTITGDVALYAQWKEYPYIDPIVQRSITIAPSLYGRVVSDRQYAATRETVTLTILPESGYLPDSITVQNYYSETTTVPLMGEGDMRTFVMPPYQVVVRASFKLYIQTDISEIRQTQTLKAFVQNGILHVSGLAAGEPLRVYNLLGMLIYQGIAADETEKILLPARGIYIVSDGKDVLKIVN